MTRKKYSMYPISCRYTPEIIQTLNEYAEHTKQSISDILRKALISFLRKEAG